MHDLEVNADSVNYLITQLCRSLLLQYDLQCNAAAVQKLKSLSFEILLKKSPHPHAFTSDNEQADFEPQRALEIQIFAAKLNAHGNVHECSKFAAFEKQLDSIAREAYFTNGAGHGVLQLLLALQGNVCEEEQVPATYEPPLLVPGPFTLHANYQHNPYYPTAVAENLLMHPTPRYFKGLQQIKSSENPYLPKFLFDGEHNKLTEIEQKFAAPTPRSHAAYATFATSSPENDCTFTGMARRFLGASMRINVRAFHLFAECSQLPEKIKLNSQSNSKTKLSSSKSIKKIELVKKYAPEEKRIFSWNWESLGRFGISCAKPFVSESNIMLDLQSLQNQSQGRQFEAKILTQQQFLQDLKSLTVGIQSDTFQHDEFIVFSMQSNITIDGVLPATISNYIIDFLECGTCYKRMQTMIMKRDYKLMFEGFMFKALCSAVDEYLLTFRQFVFAQQDQNLMAFYRRMKKMIQQISNLSFTLAIHPNVDASVKPPMGSQFLGYLYREIVRLTEKDYITLLVFILKRCCHVYFKHLQKWIFYGLLDDPSNELFICFVDHYRQNTKYFYDKAYFVRKESVPGFFQNFEDQILQCGKYTMLLKTYKPNHPIFSLEYPSISVCLSFDEIHKLETSCSQYYERARDVCGKSTATIRKMFETRAEQKRNFLQMVNQRSRENMERWAKEQHARAQIAAEKKRKRLEELTAQLQDAMQRKIDERRANVELELKFLREAEKLEEQRVIRENINLRKRIEYYQELSDMMQSDAKEQTIKLNQQQNLQLQVPITATKTLAAPQTPASATDADFESCYGDEDAVSDYVECISDDFVHKFEANESELQALCEENANNVPEMEAEMVKKEKDFVSRTSTDIEFYEGGADGCGRPFVGVTLKRSVSDVINSNELPALVMNALQKKTENMQKEESTSDACVLKVKTEKEFPRQLTEAQRNKMKVLTEEFGAYRDDTHTKSLPDINLNTLPDSELTDLQRNRRRMMQNDTFSEYNKAPLANRANLTLNLDTERARNRRKVLESEFHILTGKTTTPSPASHLPSEKTPSSSTINAPDRTASTTTFTVATPMSTTSDTPLTEDAINVFETKKSDLENGNIPAKSSGLKINIEIANEQQQNSDLLTTTAATATALPEVTPECALNTAGLNAKQGFYFADEQKIKRQHQQNVASEAPINNESLLQEDACPVQDYSAPYQRCIELIESNFKCATRSPYFRLNISPTPRQSAADICKSSESFRQLNLNSISVITLTEFLQKSVIIPMSTHLEIVNNEVMRMFLEDLRIFDHLRSLRHYFFLMDGEFGAIICDGIIGKLEDGAMPDKLLNYQMLHSILDTALGSSIMGNVKNAENLSFIVNDVPEKFDLSSPNVLNNLSLSYRINWPLNLILNPETLEQYANIFKYLIKVRRISWVLERAYQMLKEGVKKHGKQILKSPQYRHVQQMRHKFYHFVHALQNHITANALQASWKTFKDDLLQAKSIEDIYRKHTIYVKRVLFLCMLNRRSVEFYNTIENIFKISLRFYNNLKSRDFKLRPGDEHFTHSRYEKLSNDELEFDKFIKYTIYLGNKIVRHGYQAEIGEFISLINFNQYYSESVVAEKA